MGKIRIGSSESRSIGLIFVVFGAIALVSFCAAMGCLVSYRGDCVRLKAAVQAVATDIHSDSDRVLALLHWVHAEIGTAKNSRYFALPALGATPVQVLASGGDCADKARLLSAMLRESGVPATMAMCFNPTTGKPSHTIVEARVGLGAYMVVDPAFDLYFPRPGGAGYFDLLDLRRDPTILPRRLEELRAARPPADPVYSYNSVLACYNRASSINWNKNMLTRFIRDRLFTNVGDEVYRVWRPLLLEEPKLFVAGGAFLLSLAASSVWAWGVWRVRRRRAGQLYRPRSRLLFLHRRPS